MQAPRVVKAVVLAALVLVLNHARCVAACVADPCTQTQQPSCHHHKAPETKMDRGCAFPAANDGQAIAAGHDWAAQEVVSVPFVLPLSREAHVVRDAANAGPPGARLISVLRI